MRSDRGPKLHHHVCYSINSRSSLHHSTDIRTALTCICSTHFHHCKVHQVSSLPLLLACRSSFWTDFLLLFLLASFVRAVSVIDPSLSYTSLRKDAPSILGSPVNPFARPFTFFASMGSIASYTFILHFLSCDGFRLYVIAHSPHS